MEGNVVAVKQETPTERVDIICNTIVRCLQQAELVHTKLFGVQQPEETPEVPLGLHLEMSILETLNVTNKLLVALETLNSKL